MATTSKVNECIPYREPAGHVTATPSVAVTGKKAVALSAAANADGTYTVAPPSAGGAIFGVAAWNAAIGEKVTVICQVGIIIPMTAAGTIAIGAQVEVDATGAVVTLDQGVAIGTAVKAGTSGNDVPIRLFN